MSGRFIEAPRFVVVTSDQNGWRVAVERVEETRSVEPPERYGTSAEAVAAAMVKAAFTGHPLAFRAEGFVATSAAAAAND